MKNALDDILRSDLLLEFMQSMYNHVDVDKCKDYPKENLYNTEFTFKPPSHPGLPVTTGMRRQLTRWDDSINDLKMWHVTDDCHVYFTANERSFPPSLEGADDQSRLYKFKLQEALPSGTEFIWVYINAVFLTDKNS